MAFDNLPASKPVPRRPRKEPIFGVGWHAFVHWPRATDQAPRPVPLTDPCGQPVSNDLADGQEVEILSWRPRAREGLTYQIRRLGDGSEWWIGAAYLRRQRLAEGATPPSSVVVEALPVRERQ
jgi:hypothetical protein